MRILVTGGAGFIGSHLVERLLKEGHAVAVIDDFNSFYDPALKESNVKGFLASPSFSLHRADIRSKAALESVIDSFKPEAVCHLAARAGVRPSIENPALYEEVNSLGTLNLVEAVKSAGIKNFVFASSSSVYGELSKLPFSETDPAASPISPYAATKRSSEIMLHAYASLYKMPVTCLRLFTVYGERGRPDMAVARFTRMIYGGEELPVYGDGSARRDFTYVSDIVDGIEASIRTPLPYEIINLGGSKTAAVSELISTIEKKLGMKARIKHLPPAKGDVPATYADVTKAGRLLGFSPRVTLDEGIERYVKWFLSSKAEPKEAVR